MFFSISIVYSPLWKIEFWQKVKFHGKRLTSQMHWDWHVFIPIWIGLKIGKIRKMMINHGMAWNTFRQSNVAGRSSTELAMGHMGQWFINFINGRLSIAMFECLMTGRGQVILHRWKVWPFDKYSPPDHLRRDVATWGFSNWSRNIQNILDSH